MDTRLISNRDTLEPRRSAFLLECLAATVGCQASAFMTGRTGVTELDQGTEMHRLWCAVETDEGRRQILEFARRLAGQ